MAIEGGEGSGKSTQSRLLAEMLGAHLTREPGGTKVSELVRALVLDPQLVGMDAKAETLLMLAARAQHTSEVINPVLSSGRWVISDRFSASTLAYQGYGRGLALDELRLLAAWATSGRWPELNVLLDVPPEVAEGRHRLRPDRLEREDRHFHERVRQGFFELASSEPDLWAVVDGSGDPLVVLERILCEVCARLGVPSSATEPARKMLADAHILRDSRGH
ncbi:MAG: dTMP kinase [Actinobacteria bacterium]|nr:dTMP kinase [Actinomycetota bacterium]